MIMEVASSWIIELEHFIHTCIGVVNRCTSSGAYELDDGYVFKNMQLLAGFFSEYTVNMHWKLTLCRHLSHL